MFYYMYQITNLVNSKIYVGVHKTKSLDDEYMGSGKIIRRAIEKHGLTNFSKVILEYFEDAKSMYAKESLVVNEEFLLREDVYNLRRGGNGGFDYINKIGVGVRIGKDNIRTGNSELARRAGEVAIDNKLGIHADDYVHVMSDSCRIKGNLKESRIKAVISQRITFAEIGHQQGSKNSQSGTMWITNEIGNKKIKKLDLIPDGYRKGRVCRKADSVKHDLCIQ